ncbi:MAG: hypothetical protein IKD69_16300 [Solobacterium sp.]|nr:hypothetical protein [Solobacterium sp.]
MSEYAIADIGSNTVVLIIYEMQDGRPAVRFHDSRPVHLIDYVHDGIMDKEGIIRTQKVLFEYKDKALECGVTVMHADITEPCRIENVQELVDALAETGFVIHPLTGYEEAACDFYGSRLSVADIKDGIAFDVGGGSTELISFADGEIIDAMSFHLGCVRLAHLPLDTPECRKEIELAAAQYPSLKTVCSHLVGIGGTCRYASFVCDTLYQTGSVMPVAKLRKIFEDIQANDPLATAAFLKRVDPARRKVFLPGLHMILEIADFYQAETIHYSDTGIREGFLLHYVIGNES